MLPFFASPHSFVSSQQLSFFHPKQNWTACSTPFSYATDWHHNSNLQYFILCKHTDGACACYWGGATRKPVSGELHFPLCRVFSDLWHCFADLSLRRAREHVGLGYWIHAREATITKIHCLLPLFPRLAPILPQTSSELFTTGPCWHLTTRMWAESILGRCLEPPAPAAPTLFTVTWHWRLDKRTMAVDPVLYSRGDQILVCGESP